MTNRGTIAGRNNHTGRMTRCDHDGTPLTDLTHCSFWLDETDYQAVVLAALDEGCPPEALLAAIIHAWRVAREADAEMAAEAILEPVVRRTP